MSAPLEIRPLEEGDEESLLATFEAAFGRSQSLETWRWAFRRNPAGTQVQVALRGDQVVAQYAALPYRVWMDGQER
ncbi:MAG: GNAT family N-acetyltransferase, partial [Planctomycetota bacterium]|nr:GNAT family N-acetyltransferase [Planctomycetota bacterium]